MLPVPATDTDGNADDDTALQRETAWRPACRERSGRSMAVAFIMVGVDVEIILSSGPGCMSVDCGLWTVENVTKKEGLKNENGGIGINTYS